MDKVTQSNAANSEESASAAEELNGQAQELNAMIADFVLSRTGGSQSRQAGARRSQASLPGQVPAPAKAALQQRVHAKLHQGGGQQKPKEALAAAVPAGSAASDATAQQKGSKPEQAIPLSEEELKDFWTSRFHCSLW